MKPRVIVAPLVAAALALTAAVSPAAGPASAASVQPDQLVNEVPTLDTPWVRDGRVQALALVGGTVVVGGTFTKASDAGGSAITRTSVLAYDRATGRLSRTFAPVLNGQVWAVLPGPVANTVYVAGDFTTLDGVATNRLALLDTTTGAPVPGFRSPGFTSTVRALAMVRGNLVVGGVFTKAGGQPRGGIASVNPTTGRLTTFTVATYTENHNYGRVSNSSRSPVGVVQLAASPDGATLVTIGNFRRVDGVLHDQIALWDTRGTTATVRQDWTTTWFTSTCYQGVADSWVRDVDFAPDGSYFVVGSTGGGNADACDAVVRIETAASGTNVQPTWVAYTGGDSVYSTVVTDDAIYAGGHFRFFNNPNVTDGAGAGAVPRAGLVALDPRTGLPLPWNPGRHPRDKGVFAMLATDAELLVGTDTDWVGYQKYRTYKLSRFPLAGGAAAPDASVPALPARLARLDSSGTLTRYGLSAAGVDRTATTTSLGPVGTVRGAMQIGGSLYLALSDGTLHRRAWNGATLGADATLNPYVDPYWDQFFTGVNPDERYRGIDSGLANELRAANGVFYRDGQVYYVVSSCFLFFCSSTLKARAFEPGSGTSHPAARSVGSVDSSLRSITYVDGSVYWSASDGSLYRASFDGRTLGSSTRISGPSVDGVNWSGAALFVSR